jgi:hypothetical protein
MFIIIPCAIISGNLVNTMTGRRDRPSGARRRRTGSAAMSGPKGKGMSRRQFLGTAAAAGVSAAAVGLGGIAKAAPPFGELADDGYYEVYPMNNSEVDITNVQLAVMGLEMLPYPPYMQPIWGPTEEKKVRLKSMAYGTTTPTPFNFYVPDTTTFVALPYPVTIEGDGFKADGTPKTVINGGGGSTPDGPLAALTIWLEAPGPVKIDGLCFNGQTISAIGGFSFFDVEITNNMITNTISQITSLLGIEGDYRMAMVFSLVYLPFWPSEFPPSWQENPPHVLIQDNFIDNSNEMTDPDSDVLVDLGIAAVGMYDTIEYRNNVVSNKGIPLELNCNFGPSSIIDGNVVQTENRDYDNAGIWAMCHYGNTWITNNDITLLPESKGCGFMLSNPVDPDNPNDIYEVSGNRLTMGSGFAAFQMGEPGFCFIADGVPLNGALIKNNIVTGTGAVGFMCLDYPEYDEGRFDNTSSDNLILGNNLANFHPDATFNTDVMGLGAESLIFENIHIYLGPNTSNNDFRGYFGEEPWDRSDNNNITGYGPMRNAGSVGATVSTYSQSKAAMKKQAMGAFMSAMANAAKAAAQKAKEL